jgi:hypothetical protein
LFTLAAIGEVIFAGAYLATVVPLERQALSTPKAAPATHPVHVGNAQ